MVPRVHWWFNIAHTTRTLHMTIFILFFAIVWVCVCFLVFRLSPILFLTQYQQQQLPSLPLYTTSVITLKHRKVIKLIELGKCKSQWYLSTCFCWRTICTYIPYTHKTHMISKHCYNTMPNCLSNIIPDYTIHICI